MILIGSYPVISPCYNLVTCEPGKTFKSSGLIINKVQFVEKQRTLTGDEIDDWTFVHESPKMHVHGLHNYPARMHPPVARKAIRLFATHGDLVLDPFCGSGGVLVEAKIQGYRSVGIDINPLACLLARVKSSPLNPNTLYREWRLLLFDIRNELRTPQISSIVKTLKKASKIEDKERKKTLVKEVKKDFQNIHINVPDFSTINVFYWFKPKSIADLAVTKNCIDKIEEKEIRDFFYVCFSNTVRQVSGTRKGEFKLYRIPVDKWNDHNPDTLGTFARTVVTNIAKMGEFYEVCKRNDANNTLSLVLQSDTRKIFTSEFPKEGKEVLFEKNGDEIKGKVNLIVTSPPYGDSGTTVAYGQFSRDSLFWLGYPKEEFYDIDRVSIGGRKKEEEINSESLDRTLKVISSKDQKRATQVKSFFVDLNECLLHLYRIMADGGNACFVLGNRTVKRTRIPTDKIIVELGEPIGFRCVHTFSRRIPIKRIPWKSSPTNIPGKTVNTIGEENIIVLRKA